MKTYIIYIDDVKFERLATSLTGFMLRLKGEGLINSKSIVKLNN
jgi:hypothetical protein